MAEKQTPANVEKTFFELIKDPKNVGQILSAIRVTAEHYSPKKYEPEVIFEKR